MAVLSYSVADFQPFTKISSSDINSKFSDVKTFVDTLSTSVDSATTAVAKLPATPSSLAYVTVAPTTGNMASVRLGEYDNGASGAAKTINLSNGPTQKVSVDQATTLTFSNPVDGESYVLLLLQSGGSYTVTYSTSNIGAIKWSNGVAPTSSASGKIDIINLFYSGSTMYGTYASNF